MKIDNKVIAAGTILMLAAMVYAGGSIWTDAAQLYFNDTGIFLENVTIHGGDADDYIEIETGLPEVLSAVPYVIPLQLFAYYMALERKCDPDMPRNLAKSVTVK